VAAAGSGEYVLTTAGGLTLDPGVVITTAGGLAVREWIVRGRAPGHRLPYSASAASAVALSKRPVLRSSGQPLRSSLEPAAATVTDGQGCYGFRASRSVVQVNHNRARLHGCS
jgi:hypothetical protein